mmetsp:Transcript_158513/g.508521  ORF Transcript_158513/g.508521 Transcript_158513/m.508521 type:complete len:213 (-) Transcript_158513:499-1137(-)
MQSSEVIVAGSASGPTRPTSASPSTARTAPGAGPGGPCWGLRLTCSARRHRRSAPGEALRAPSPRGLGMPLRFLRRLPSRAAVIWRASWHLPRGTPATTTSTPPPAAYRVLAFSRPKRPARVLGRPPQQPPPPPPPRPPPLWRRRTRSRRVAVGMPGTWWFRSRGKTLLSGTGSHSTSFWSGTPGPTARKSSGVIGRLVAWKSGDGTRIGPR